MTVVYFFSQNVCTNCCLVLSTVQKCYPQLIVKLIALTQETPSHFIQFPQTKSFKLIN